MPVVPKLLIIKTGHFETFNLALWTNTTVSLGDVLRSTILLNYLKDYEITWYTSEEAKLLLTEISEISFVISDKDQEIKELNFNSFDLIINLEPINAPLVTFPKTIGFINKNNEVFLMTKNQFCLKAELMNSYFKENVITTWGQKLCWIISSDNSKSSYHISSPDSQSNTFDIGFNWKVGTKIKEKLIPEKYWQEWKKDLDKEFEISWQKGEKNLMEYINWINSCRTIVTCDSLGLHIGLALEKKVIGLFVVTSPEDIDMQGLGKNYFVDLSAFRSSIYLNEPNVINPNAIAELIKKFVKTC